jgi:hypothetical protein
MSFVDFNIVAYPQVQEYAGTAAVTPTATGQILTPYWPRITIEMARAIKAWLLVKRRRIPVITHFLIDDNEVKKTV